MTGRSGTRRRRVGQAVGGYLAALAAAWLALWVAADDWSPATLLAFGPRWVLAVPSVPLAVWAVAANARWAVAGVLAAAGLVAGPICGGVVSVPAATPGRPAVRVLTCNLGGRAARPDAVRRLVEDAGPDVVTFQEAPADPAPLLPPGYQFATFRGLVVAARHPVKSAGGLGEADLGSPGSAGRFTVAAPTGELVVIDLHLPTVRPALELAARRPTAGPGALAESSADRDRASAAARQWLGQLDHGAIVAGDFNMPTESRIYARHWGDFRNAFSAAGLGWGATKQTRWLGIRIDHILTHPDRVCRRAWVGPDVGSDHRPVLADLAPPPE